MPIEMKQKKGGFRVIGSGSGGKSSDSSSSSPTEAPDSLHNTSYAAILDVISNGEVYGPAHPNNPLRDVYLDGTPVENEDGTLNFENISIDYRVGTVDQDHISGFPATASTTDVSVEVQTSVPWTQTISGSDLSAVRVSIHVPTLLKTYDSGDNAGDRVGYKVEYAIDVSTDGGSFNNVISTSFDGKTVNGYTRTHRIDLPEGSSWTIRVRRITPEANNTTIQDAIYVDSYTEVIDGKFRFPMTALIGIKVDAEQFSSIPTRSYHWKGRIIRVPSNYDPDDRTYLGVWDGTFKLAYSNNPAWVFFDMVTNQLYGMGNYINASMINRYELYQIGAYCDQLVDDGNGGTEPRFVCNAYIQAQEDALHVLNDLSSIFRGMAYWSAGEIVAVADMPSDPVYTYTNANVIDGRFEYAGADISTLKTVALVSWNDPSDFYKSKVEAVEDSDGIARYGVRKTDVIAFGCTSRAQAQRVGLYILYTNRMESNGITFSVGLDGVIPQPGDLVRIADRNRAGRHLGGRIRSATSFSIVVDRDEHPAKIGDTLTVNLPSGVLEERNITDVDGREITVGTTFSEIPVSQSVWAIDSDDLVTQLVRVTSIAETDGITFAISGVFHHPDKFDAIDNGVRLDPLPVSVVPPRTQTAPTNIQINEFYSYKQGTTRHSAEITWDAPENAVAYDVQWKRDNGDWVTVARKSSRLVELTDIYAGTYSVRVRAVNSLDVVSLWAYSEATELDGAVGAPPVLNSLTAIGEVMAITLNWEFPTTANIISYVEIRASLTSNFDASYALTTVSYPATSYTLYGLGYGSEIYFWARVVDKNGEAGEWYPDSNNAGVRGISSSSATEILEYLNGQISRSQLAQDLITELDSIDPAAVEEVQQTVDDLESGLLASWQVKTQVRTDGKVVQSGVAVGASIDPDGVSRSEILLMADTIALLTKLDGDLHAPFVFDAVNDTAILNAAIIGNATIDFAKISDTLQSTNFVSGSTGWRIRKNGNAEFNNGTFRGTLDGVDGNFTGTVYVENLEGDVTDTELISVSSTVGADVARPSSGTAYGYATIGTLNFGTVAWARKIVVLGNLRFDNSGGAARVEFVRNGSVVYYSDSGGTNSYEIDGENFTHAGSFTVPANSSGVITVRIRAALSSGAAVSSGDADFYPQSIVAHAFKN